MTPRDSAPAEHRRRASVPYLTLFTANALMSISTSMQFVLAPLYVIARGATDFEAGLTITCFMVAALLFRPLSGHFVDATGRQSLVLVGGSVFAVVTAALVGAPEIWLFLVARALQGIGFSLGGTAAMTIATDLLPMRRLEGGLGLLGLEASLTQAIGPVIALWASSSAGFEVAFTIAAAAAAGSVLVRLADHRRVRELDRLRRVDHGGVLRRQLIAIEAWRPATVTFLLTFATAAVTTFLPLYALSRGIDGSAAFFASMGISMALARLLLGSLRTVLGEHWLMIVSIAAHAAALLVVWWTDGIGWFVVAGLLFGWGSGVFSPSFTGLATRASVPARRGQAAAAILFAMDSAMAAGGLVFGIIAAAAGTAAVFPAAAALVVAALLLYVLLIARPRAGTAPSSPTDG